MIQSTQNCLQATVESELNFSLNYDNSADISTTYLGRDKINASDTFHAEGSFPIYSQ